MGRRRTKPNGVARGYYTKQNVWDKARALKFWRGGEKIDPGVNYFVAMLNQMGLPTAFSCEGHPDGFYVTFDASYKAALKIKNCGFFGVEIEHESHWSIRLNREEKSERRHIDCLRWAAEAWEKKLGPLVFQDIQTGCPIRSSPKILSRVRRHRC